MPARAPVVVDDRLLIRHLLGGLEPDEGVALSTTAYWYYRACRAAVVGAGGQLSGPFSRLGASRQAAAIRSLLHLPHDVALPDPRATVPVMAAVAERHPRLNLLNLEAAAAASTLDATVWLSPPAAAGLLPSVLDDEGIPWRTVEVAT